MNNEIDLSVPDNSELKRGRSWFAELLWHFLGAPLVRAESLPFSWLKVWVLRVFGARIGRDVYIKPRVRVKFPWKLEIGDHCWIGEAVWIDNLEAVKIGSHVCISQEVYLCTGNHDWSSPCMKLYTKPIIVEDGSWICARSVVFAGVTIGHCSVVVGGSVVSKAINPYEIHGGNPAVFVKQRLIRRPDLG